MSIRPPNTVLVGHEIGLQKRVNFYFEVLFLKIHPEAVAATQLNTPTAGVKTGKYTNT